MKRLLEELGISQRFVTIYCDNQSALQLTKRQVYHERTKHIDVMLYYIRDIIAEGSIKVEKIHTSENMVDSLTKALPVAKFQLCSLLMKVHKGVLQS